MLASHIDNILDHVFRKFPNIQDIPIQYVNLGRVPFILPGSVPDTFTEPPLRVCIFGSFERGAELFKACTEDPYIRQWIKIVGVATDDPEKFPWLAKSRIWKYPEAYAKRRLVPDLVDQYNQVLDDKDKIPVFIDRIKDPTTKEMTPEFVAFLEKCNADMALMGTFGQLITKPIINAFNVGFFNFHPTAAPQVWPHPDDVGPRPFEAMVERSCKTACLAVHWVSPEFDDGPMVSKTASVDIPPNVTPVQMHELTSPLVRSFIRDFFHLSVEPALAGYISFYQRFNQPIPYGDPKRSPMSAKTGVCASGTLATWDEARLRNAGPFPISAPQ